MLDNLEASNNENIILVFSALFVSLIKLFNQI